MIKSALVTGGVGFIGSHTCVELVAVGFEVVILDKLCNSRRSVVERIGRIAGRRAAFVEGDIRDRAKKIISLTGVKSRLEFRPLPSDDPMQRQPDIQLARKTLGWEPATTLEKGLRKTVQYFSSGLQGTPTQ